MPPLRHTLCGLTLLVLFMMMGCASGASKSMAVSQAGLSSFVYVEGVPFYSQTEYQCGPASLAAVLNYWGRAVSPEEIAETIYIPRLKGSLNLDLWRYAMDQGLDARIHRGSLQDLEMELLQNRPVIAFLNLGYRFYPVGHFLVVVGLDPQQGAVIVNSGKEKDKRIPYKKFLAAWKKTQYWSLWINLKDRRHG